MQKIQSFPTLRAMTNPEKYSSMPVAKTCVFLEDPFSKIIEMRAYEE
jgi:hypothetical protein